MEINLTTRELIELEGFLSTARLAAEDKEITQVLLPAVLSAARSETMISVTSKIRETLAPLVKKSTLPQC